MREEGSLREVYEKVAKRTRPTQQYPKSMTARSLTRLNGIVVPKVGSKREVFNGSALRTPGHLFKRDLKQNADGSIVSRRASSAAKSNNSIGQSKLKIWRWAVAMANKDEGRKRGGKGNGVYIAAPKKGSRLYTSAKRLYNQRLNS